jgi:hypothetical protein
MAGHDHVQKNNKFVAPGFRSSRICHIKESVSLRRREAPGK